MATESPILPAEINESFGSPRRRRRVSDAETNRLLELLKADDCVDEGGDWIEGSGNPLDELYSAALQQEEATTETEESETEIDVEALEVESNEKQQVRKKRGKSRIRRPKPYSALSGTLKIPTPILPNLQADSASRPLQYHQYQPATPTPSGTSSAK